VLDVNQVSDYLISFSSSNKKASRKLFYRHISRSCFNSWKLSDEVFTEVEPIIKSVLDGYNACIFAYGQTGTGKTFTMVRTS
jgi:Cdc6-like AAA superfamily ATPase